MGNGLSARFDAIVVGARCAGAPTAMLLARKGYRVVMLDRDSFPSNMPHSTHLIHPMGVAYLKSWGLLEAVEARCATFKKWHVDMHGIALEGEPPAHGGVELCCAPRRRVLDEILVRGAERAGAELREGCRVTDLVFDDDGRVSGIRAKDRGGRGVSERARIVIGADGPASMVARCAGAEERHAAPVLQGNIWTYWAGVALEGLRISIHEKAGAFAFPSSDGSVLVAANLIHGDFVKARRTREQAYYAMLERVAPELRAMLDGAEQVDRLFAGCTRSFVRSAHGPGWALVGDAGMKKDPVTAQGIAGAFACADRLASAIDDGFSGRRPLAEALAAYERERDDWLMPYYDYTVKLAAFAKPTAEQMALYRALAHDDEGIGQFFGTVSLSVSPNDFLAPGNLRRILRAAQV